MQVILNKVNVVYLIIYGIPVLMYLFDWTYHNCMVPWYTGTWSTSTCICTCSCASTNRVRIRRFLYCFSDVGVLTHYFFFLVGKLRKLRSEVKWSLGRLHSSMIFVSRIISLFPKLSCGQFICLQELTYSNRIICSSIYYLWSNAFVYDYSFLLNYLCWVDMNMAVWWNF